ncbi:hypothetical protein [Sphingomonas sp. 28-62-11]|uniref:Acg family FMN-binding oxidoreductase n=1 Tax=Sphingomonas sp. 28-62-11 TaxID=1970432 RepID=UPI000BD0EC2C|nr:MAG: twin-arginine translocation pathway signal protein [Sphingomonas sp. 28-62-11]
MERRGFIKLAGGGIVLAAVGSVATFSLTRTPVAALAPWADARTTPIGDPRRYALAHAILAPNPHNRQPWIADIRVPGQITLFVDTNRMLPQTDPFNRQITIGLGCFLELLTMAAAQCGYRVDLDLFPDGETSARLTGGRVAVARFVRDPSVRSDPLFRHVYDRRSNKDPFDTAKAVSPTSVTRLTAVARHGNMVTGSVDSASITRLRTLTEQALRVEVETPRTFKESVDLFRIGRTEIERQPDGIDFSGPLFEGLALAGMFDRKTLADPKSSGYAQGLKAVLDNASSAMGHIWMVSRDNSRKAQIAAGRDWVRLNLAATRDGIAFHPLSQALQEYPEMESLYRDAHRLLAPHGGTVQMLSRIGFGTTPAPSPRWPFQAKLLVA